MAEINDIVRVAVDAYHGNVTKYSMNDSMELLQKALVEANGGSTKLNYKAIRDGKCNGLFTIIEEILSRTVVEGVQKNDFFMNMVDFRNIALGDQNKFLVEKDNLFTVAEVAPGTQGIRRQRLSGLTEFTLTTTPKAVKIYDELNRVLAGQVDFNYFIKKVSDSFERKLLDDIYAIWMGATADDFGGEAYFTAGAYDEDAMLELIAHVEAAANGQPAMILGTKPALRNLAPAIQSAESKSDLYNLGFYGRYYGTPVMALPQRHKVDSTEFVMSDKQITVIAGDQKPIKCVYEGDSIIHTGDPFSNADLSQELEYIINVIIAPVF